MNQKFTFFALIYLLVSPDLAYAGGLRVLNQDAEAAGRGNAFVALADNPSAVFYNPAGITELQDFEFSAGVNAILGDAYYDTGLDRSSVNEELTFLPQSFGVYRQKGSDLTLGLGLYAPFGSGIDWPRDSGFASHVTTASVQHITLSPVLAWEISPSLSIAAGPTVNYVKLESSHTISPFPVDTNYQLKGDAVSVGYIFGLRWAPTEQHSFGFRYFSSTHARFEGESSATGLPDANNVTASLNFPEFYSLGYAYQPRPNLNLELDFDWTNWGRVNTLEFSNTSLGNTLSPLEWEPAIAIMLGATQSLDAGYSISLGYSFLQNAVPTTRFTPAVPDTNVHYATFGVSKKCDGWSWAVAYQHGFANDRSISGTPLSPVQESTDGDYSIVIDAVSASVSF